MSHKTQYVLQGLLSAKIGKAYQSEAQLDRMNGFKKDSLTRNFEQHPRTISVNYFDHALVKESYNFQGVIEGATG